MNKYSITFCFVLLTAVMCITKTGSRKRYRNKKKSAPHVLHKSVNTHMNVDAYQEQQQKQNEQLLQATKSADATGMPQIQQKINKAHQYHDPFVEPQKPVAQDIATKPIEIPPAPPSEEEDDE